MSTQIFLSHTKQDEKICDNFDKVAARVGIKLFRSEFEDIIPPAWETIKKEIAASKALFLLVGKELVASQAKSDESISNGTSWKFTQNWISYEVGIACQLGIDVWVICDSTEINFPVPYLTNYDIHGLDPKIKANFQAWKKILDLYQKGFTFPLGKIQKRVLTCPHETCKSRFGFHSVVHKGKYVICPTCLRKIPLKTGWLLPP